MGKMDTEIVVYADMGKLTKDMEDKKNKLQVGFRSRHTTGVLNRMKAVK